MARIKIDLRPGETVTIGGAVITMVKKSGQLASLVIEAEKEVPIKGPQHLREVKQEPMAVCLP